VCNSDVLGEMGPFSDQH